MITERVAEFYALKVVIDYKGRVSTFTRTIYLDPSLKEGWPIHINWDKIYEDVYIKPGDLAPVVADINNDGFEEIIVYKYGKPSKIYAFDHNGKLLDGWPANIENGNSGLLTHKQLPVVVDINNDGFKEVLYHSGPRVKLLKNGSTSGVSDLYVIRHDGSMLPGWPVEVPPEYAARILSEDLDLDGQKEIIIKGLYSGWQDNGFHNVPPQLVVLNNLGQIISQWQIATRKYSPNYPPAIGNFDQDPDLEIIVEYISPGSISSPTNSIIYAYNIDGSVVNGWSFIPSRRTTYSLAIGDVSGDGNLEIVATSLNSDGVYLFDNHGNLLPGWPVLDDWPNVRVSIVASPALADFDRDGNLEIVVSGWNTIDRFNYITEVYVISSTGKIVEGWPRALETDLRPWYSMIVGDVNNDAIPDILTSVGGILEREPGGIFAWDFQGDLIDGFPKVTEERAIASPVISDIDGDGVVELIASSPLDVGLGLTPKNRGSIYVWELDSKFTQKTMEWPTFMHDNQLTGLYTQP